MKELRKIQPIVDLPGAIELYDLRRDNLLRVENRGDCVVIRAARSNVSAASKESFIRYLATEGFVPEQCQWNSSELSPSLPEVTWVADDSWVSARHRLIRLASLVWAYLTWGRLLSLALFITALVIAVWLKRH